MCGSQRFLCSLSAAQHDSFPGFLFGPNSVPERWGCVQCAVSVPALAICSGPPWDLRDPRSLEPWPRFMPAMGKMMFLFVFSKCGASLGPGIMNVLQAGFGEIRRVGSIGSRLIRKVVEEGPLFHRLPRPEATGGGPPSEVEKLGSRDHLANASGNNPAHVSLAAWRLRRFRFRATCTPKLIVSPVFLP